MFFCAQVELALGKALMAIKANDFRELSNYLLPRRNQAVPWHRVFHGMVLWLFCLFCAGVR